jgi:D-erythronate 2-dehydrogenase
MRIVITGAGGFVGRALVERLQANADLVLIDHVLDRASSGEHHIGDLTNPELLSAAFAGGCDALLHLATVPGGAAEANPDAAWRVNVDGTMMLIDHAQRAGSCPRVVFASSIAVFGEAMPSLVDDACPLAPKLVYGAHKAMGELWIDALTRRGDISGLSLRLPGIVARPAAASGMISAFMSDVFHALRAGEHLTVPVSAGATMWLMSVDQVAMNLAHSLTNGAIGAMTLPALQVRFADLVAEIAGQTGHPASLIQHAPQLSVEKAFGMLPELRTPRANEAGFAHDGDTANLVARVLAHLNQEQP